MRYLLQQVDDHECVVSYDYVDVCGKCGSLVAPGHQTKHKEIHDYLSWHQHGEVG